MSRRHEAGEQERKMFVSGLNKTLTDEAALQEYFETYGEIVDCTIMRYQDGQSRRFGFILFKDSSSVDKIMSLKREGVDFVLNENYLQVKRALPEVKGGYAASSRIDELHKKVFIGGLPSTITEKELREYFEQYGRVNVVQLFRDRETNLLRKDFGFITFDNEDCAHKCIQKKYHEICNKICDAKRAETKNLVNRDEQGRRSRKRDSDQQTQSSNGPAAAAAPMSMSQVTYLIQQAYMMGQQGKQPGVQAPPSASLNGAVAFMNQQPVAPVPPAPGGSGNTDALRQLGEILQAREIDINSLVSLLKGGQPAADSGAGKTADTSMGYNWPVNRQSKDDSRQRYYPY